MFNSLPSDRRSPTRFMGSVGTNAPVMVVNVSFPSTAYPAANRVTYIPIYVPIPCNAIQMWCTNGTVSGNIELGIYSCLGTVPGRKLVSTGSVAQASANANQFVSITSTKLVPGRYFLAVTLDNTTGQLAAVAGSVLGATQALGAMAESLGSFGLPANATPVKLINNYYPVMGIKVA